MHRCVQGSFMWSACSCTVPFECLLFSSIRSRTNTNLCRDSRETLVGGLLRSSKPGGGTQLSEKVVQRCHYDSLGDTNFRACHFTRRRFAKFATRAYFSIYFSHLPIAETRTTPRLNIQSSPSTHYIIQSSRLHNTLITS